MYCFVMKVVFLLAESRFILYAELYSVTIANLGKTLDFHSASFFIFAGVLVEHRGKKIRLDKGRGRHHFASCTVVLEYTV